MNVLVTGATGYVGGHLLSALLSQGDQVNALVRSPAGQRRLTDAGIPVVRGSLSDVDALRRAVQEVDVVVHCAAASRGALEETNVRGTRNLLEAACRQKCPPRVVLLSSLTVVDEGEHTGAEVEVRGRKRLWHPYIRSKIAAEVLARAQARREGLPVVILRPGLVHGGHGDRHLTGMVRSIEGGRFAFLGERPVRLPFIHVSDLVRAICLAMTSSRAPGRIFPLADGQALTLRDVVGELVRVRGGPMPTRVISPRVLQAFCLATEAVQRLSPRVPAPGLSRATLSFLTCDRVVDLEPAAQHLDFRPSMQFPARLEEALAQAGQEPKLSGHEVAPPETPSFKGVGVTKVEDLRTARVRKTVLRYWVRPNRPAPLFRVPPKAVQGLSERTLDAMLAHRFRVGPRPDGAVRAVLLERVRARVARGAPILVRMGYGALKNGNNTAQAAADWAEFFALNYLIAWHNAVTRVYPPGLSIQLCFDDAFVIYANKADPDRIRTYVASIERLVRMLDLDAVIVKTLSLAGILPALQHSGLFWLAKRRVIRWERDPANRDQVDAMTLHAQRCAVPPAGLRPEQLEAFWQGAAHRYRVAWEAIRMSGLTGRGEPLFAMYLDGQHHHRPDPTALHLRSLCRGQITQPWQGRGVLLDNGQGKLVPTVETRRRSQRFHRVAKVHLDLFPVPELETIDVMAQSEPSSGPLQSPPGLGYTSSRSVGSSPPVT